MIDEAHLQRLELVARAAKLKVTARVHVIPVEASEYCAIVEQLRADRERIAEMEADAAERLRRATFSAVRRLRE